MSVAEVHYSLSRSHNEMSSFTHQEASIQDYSRLLPGGDLRSRSKSVGEERSRSKDTKPVMIRKVGLSLARKTKSRMQLELLMRDFQKLSINATPMQDSKPLIVKTAKINTLLGVLGTVLKTSLVRRPIAASIFQTSSIQNSTILGDKRPMVVEHDSCKICNEVVKEKLTDHAIQRVYLMAHGKIMPKDMITKVHKSFDKALGASNSGSTLPQIKGAPSPNKYYNPKSLNIDQELDKLFKPLAEGQIYDPRITKTEKSSLPKLPEVENPTKKEIEFT